MAKRQSIMWPGFARSNPIPNASRIGDIRDVERDRAA